MKTLLLLTLLTIGGLGDAETDELDWVMEEIRTDMGFENELEFIDYKIRLFDVEGNPVGTYSMDKYILNELSLDQMQTINHSDFLFEHQGDGYYFVD